MKRLLLVSFLAGCADITPIEDGAVYGDVEVVQDWFTSISLVRTDSTTLLIDAGFRPGKVSAALEGRGIDPASVDHVLLTHGHDDHIGALEIYTGATVWGLAAEEGLLTLAGVGNVEVLEPGLRQLGDIDVEVFALPGHTPGTAVYRVGETLLLGDAALINEDGALVPVPEKRSEDPAEAEESLYALAEGLRDREDITWVVPSHSGGGSIQVLQALVD